jgi:hypothetical protein
LTFGVDVDFLASGHEGPPDPVGPPSLLGQGIGLPLPPPPLLQPKGDGSPLGGRIYI